MLKPYDESAARHNLPRCLGDPSQVCDCHGEWACRPKSNEMLPMPNGITYRNGSNEPCDILHGPCSCGGWHHVDEWQERLRGRVFPEAKPVAQQAVPGGLIGSAGVSPSSTSFRTYDPVSRKFDNEPGAFAHVQATSPPSDIDDIGPQKYPPGLKGWLYRIADALP